MKGQFASVYRPETVGKQVDLFGADNQYFMNIYTFLKGVLIYEKRHTQCFYEHNRHFNEKGATYTR
jgi:hypothetical protein